MIVSQGKILGDLPLTLADLMSLESGETVQKKLSALIRLAQGLGILSSVDPFISLSIYGTACNSKASFDKFGTI